MDNNYEFVNVRFNLGREDEKFLFEKLNPKNKGGSIKDFLKSYFAVSDVSLMKKTELKEIIKDIIDNEMDVEKEKDIQSSSSYPTNRIKMVVGGKEVFL